MPEDLAKTYFTLSIFLGIGWWLVAGKIEDRRATKAGFNKYTYDGRFALPLWVHTTAAIVGGLISFGLALLPTMH